MLAAYKHQRLLVDAQGELLASKDPHALTNFKLMKFSQQVANRYGLQSNRVSSLKDFESRMDRAIGGLEYEIYLKQGECNRLME